MDFDKSFDLAKPVDDEPRQYKPNRGQRPLSNQFESHLRAKSPAIKLSAIPRRLGIKRWAMLTMDDDDACCSFNKRMASRTIIGGVSTTARAKLNSSIFLRGIPNSSPVDIVAPERENPRNGKQMP